MFWHQASLQLRRRPRGFHLVTPEILAALPEVRRLRVGFLSLFLQHTSASLAINENADPDVRSDLERWANQAIPEEAPYFEHTTEGPDDMPAHVKTAVFGISLQIPVRDGRLQLGTWQGVYLGEHRDHADARTVVATVWGEAEGPDQEPGHEKGRDGDRS
jgi:secondary thiamine-phosphate synthase enzyme